MPCFGKRTDSLVALSFPIPLFDHRYSESGTAARRFLDAVEPGSRAEDLAIAASSALEGLVNVDGMTFSVAAVEGDQVRLMNLGSNLILRLSKSEGVQLLVEPHGSLSWGDVVAQRDVDCTEKIRTATTKLEPGSGLMICGYSTGFAALQPPRQVDEAAIAEVIEQLAKPYEGYLRYWAALLS
jgi:hypothetical protein